MGDTPRSTRSVSAELHEIAGQARAWLVVSVLIDVGWWLCQDPHKRRCVYEGAIRGSNGVWEMGTAARFTGDARLGRGRGRPASRRPGHSGGPQCGLDQDVRRQSPRKLTKIVRSETC